MDTLKYIADLIERSSKDAPKTGDHITRFQMYRSLKDCLKAHDAPGKTALSISGSQRIAKESGVTSATLTNVQYPEYDVCNLPFEPESFDFIFSDQVMEHVRGDIPKLYRDLATLLKPGGFMLNATPFIMELHPAPLDCWRFGPDGLRWLAEQAGLDVIEVDGWGNRLAWLHIMLGHRMTPVPDDETHPTFKLATYNERHVPIVVWIICRKPVSDNSAPADAEL
ncbi:class I SAM-dependent methyltransferase [Rhodopseudomonas palustris]|nr:class I SAM-dependent methyltransferase [Rhodopseudomonas palustris]